MSQQNSSEGTGSQASRSDSVREVVDQLRTLARDLGDRADSATLLREAACGRVLQNYLERRLQEDSVSPAEALNASRYNPEVQKLDQLTEHLANDHYRLRQQLARLNKMFPSVSDHS